MLAADGTKKAISEVTLTDPISGLSQLGGVHQMYKCSDTYACTLGLLQIAPYLQVVCKDFADCRIL